jgi:voltage-gated sodium channel
MSIREPSVTLPLFARVRELARAITESLLFQQFIVVVIIINAVTLGLETIDFESASVEVILSTIDHIALAIFVVEIGLKLIAQGRRFFSSGWNLFDVAIVGISFAPAAGGLSVLRVLRILRISRLFSVVPSLRLIVEALVGAIPGMTSIMLVLALIFYISSVLATKIFGEQFPQQFGSLDVSALTLFQLMTLDGWSGEIVRPVMERYPWSWLFFIPFIVITSFAVLNLFIGVLMSNIEAQQEQREVERDELLRETINRMAAEMSEVRAMLRERAAEAPPRD